MKKLLKNKKGFTLMEMLIVIAIIVILVAVSVPTFTGQLNKAKEATDSANLRAAKSAAIAEYMVEGDADIVGKVYNPVTGEFVAKDSLDAYGESSTYSKSVILVYMNGTNIDVKWDEDAAK